MRLRNWQGKPLAKSTLTANILRRLEFSLCFHRVEFKFYASNKLQLYLGFFHIRFTAVAELYVAGVTSYLRFT